MRDLMLTLGLGIFTCGLAAAQDAARPTVQVVVGADGQIRVLDPKTGKELPSVVTRVPGKATLPTGTPDGVLRAIAVQIEKEESRGQAQKTEKEALERALKALATLQDAKKGDKKPEGLQLELQIGPGGEVGKVIVVQKKKIVEPKPENLEGKIDRLLKEMAELRKDVNQLKGKLEGRGGTTWQQYVPSLPSKGKKEGEGYFYFRTPPKEGDKEKKPAQGLQVFPLPGGGVGTIRILLDGDLSPKERKEVEEMLKKLGVPADFLKKKEPAPKPADRELEQRLERLLREAEELRREILKSKGK